MTPRTGVCGTATDTSDPSSSRKRGWSYVCLRFQRFWPFLVMLILAALEREGRGECFGFSNRLIAHNSTLAKRMCSGSRGRSG